MKLIIDIPEDVYEEIMIHNRELRASGKSSYYLEGLIQNGIPYVEPKQGDIISREALKKAINANGCRHSHYFDVFDVIDDVPTIQPKYFPPCEDCNKKMEEIRNAYDKMKAMERPQGKWLHNSDRPDNWICSVCNCGWDMWRYESKELKYCPNCGAEMEKAVQNDK